MKKLFTLLLALALLAACGNNQVAEQGSANNDRQAEEATLLPVEVEIVSTGDQFQPGKEGVIEVKVTQGTEAVADANEVLIEIWQRDQQDKSINYEAENMGGGLYTLAHTFPEDAIYYVVAHVTARDMHVMPRKEFVVGEAAMNVQAGLPHHHGQHGHHDQHGHHHGAGEGLSIHVMPPDILKAGEEALWTVHLAEENGQPLTEATVRFDYWQDGHEHTLVDAAETVAGEYTAEFSFPQAGEFRIVVHIEKDELHEHEETRVQVE